MEKYLKQSPGIDVSKLNLSLSLGSLNEKLFKEFESHADVSNDLKGYKVLLKWLKASVDSEVELLVVMEATGVYHQVSKNVKQNYELKTNNYEKTQLTVFNIDLDWNNTLFLSK